MLHLPTHSDPINTTADSLIPTIGKVSSVNFMYVIFSG